MRANEFISETVIKLRGFSGEPKSSAYIEAVEQVCDGNPMNHRQLVFQNAAVLELVRDFDDHDAVELKDIRGIVPQGGAKAMDMLCQMADQMHTTLTLYAKGYAHVPTEKLVPYYCRFGFEPQDDVEHIDMKHDGVAMRRSPR